MLLKQSDEVNHPAEQPYPKGQAHVSRMLTMARIQPVALVCQMALQQSSSSAGFIHFPNPTYTPCCNNNLTCVT